MKNPFTSCISVIMVAVVMAVLMLPPSARAASKTKLDLVTGSKEFVKYLQKYDVETPEDLYFRWQTDEVGAVGGNWQVTTINPANQLIVVAKGALNSAPASGHVSNFTIPANAFLAAAPPAAPKIYNVTITPCDAKKNPLGTPSAPVVITQYPAGPVSPPTQFDFGQPVFPSVRFLRYFAVPSTYVPGALLVTVQNDGKTPTDSVVLSGADKNFLLSSESVVIPILKPGASMQVKVKLNAKLPPPKQGNYGPTDTRQQWAQDYHDKGIDLEALLNWRQQEFRHVQMYKGREDSCQDGKFDGDEEGKDLGGSCGCTIGRNVDTEGWRKLNGFQFTNSGAFNDMVGGYTVGDMQDLYGDCAIFVSCFPPIPIPDPVTVTSLAVLDAALTKGQCFGMSLATLRFINGDQKLSDYPSVTSNTDGAPACPSCDVWHLKGKELEEGKNVSPDLARYIHRQHALQLSAEAISRFLKARIINDLQYLKGNLRANLPAVLSLEQGGSGHAIVAHHLIEHPDGSFDIQCYDPNVPWNPTAEKASPAHLLALAQSTVKVKADGSYVFDDGHGVSFKGSASADLTVFPYSIFANPHLPSLADVAAATIFGGVTGNATITQVTDALGHPLFLANGALNNDPQTRVIARPFYPMDGPAGSPTRFIVMEAKGTFTHRIAPTGAYQLRFVGPDYAVDIDQISGHAGETDEVSINAKAASLELTTSAPQKEMHGKLMVHAADKSTRVAALRVTLSHNARVHLEFDPRRETLQYRHTGAAANLTLELWSSHNPKATYSAKPILVEAGDLLTIKPNWQTLGSAPGALHVVKRNGTASDITLR